MTREGYEALADCVRALRTLVKRREDIARASGVQSERLWNGGDMRYEKARSALRLIDKQFYIYDHPDE